MFSSLQPLRLLQTFLALPSVRGLKKLALTFPVMIVGCATSTILPIRTVDDVDLDRFAGEWYVIATTPTILEKNAYNAVEVYDPPVDGVVNTTFRFNKDSLVGPLKEYHPKGFVKKGTGNAVWGMQFVWPIKAEYRVVHLDDDYKFTIVGRTKRDYVWVMARDSHIEQADYDRLLKIVADEGYDLGKIRKVPHTKR